MARERRSLLNLGNIGRFRVAGLSFQRTDHAELGGCNSHGRSAKKNGGDHE
jgi:hypothetical protein